VGMDGMEGQRSWGRVGGGNVTVDELGGWPLATMTEDIFPVRSRGGLGCWGVGTLKGLDSFVMGHIVSFWVYICFKCILCSTYGVQCPLWV
jgi:hypothetical protein